LYLQKMKMVARLEKDKRPRPPGKGKSRTLNDI
jgi:hypothetical protein